MNEAHKLLSSLIPLPFIVNASLYDGLNEKQPSRCVKCTHRECTQRVSASVEHNECREGLSFYVVELFEEKVILNGLITTDRNRKADATTRRDLKRLSVTYMEVQRLMDRLTNISEIIARELNLATKETVSFLHDVRSALSVVVSNCESVISYEQGANFSSKLHQSGAPLRNLYDSIQLLTEQLNFADLITNPASITFGRRSRCSINGFLYKIVKLFESRAATHGVRVHFNGSDDQTSVFLYDSFQAVPLILLDNAIKYCDPKSTISVSLVHEATCMRVIFTSYGDVVPDGFHELIFERHVRGPNAIEKDVQGSGIGLSIAKAIVEAHGYSIRYTSAELSRQNFFTISIPKAHIA